MDFVAMMKADGLVVSVREMRKPSTGETVYDATVRDKNGDAVGYGFCTDPGEAEWQAWADAGFSLNYVM